MKLLYNTAIIIVGVCVAVGALFPLTVLSDALTSNYQCILAYKAMLVCTCLGSLLGGFVLGIGTSNNRSIWIPLGAIIITFTLSIEWWKSFSRFQEAILFFICSLVGSLLGTVVKVGVAKNNG